MAQIIFRDNRGVRRTKELETRTCIGRHPEQDIQILDRVVSKAHAVIERNMEGVFVVHDRGSRNGTFVNGAKIAGPTVLNDGDTISVGSTELLYREDPTQIRHGQKVTTAYARLNRPPGRYRTSSETMA